MLRTPYFLLALLIACNKPSPPTLFTELSPEQTGVAFANSLPEQSPEGMNIIQYLYYYNGGGVAAGDVNNDGLPDLYFTSNLGPNRLYLNKGNWQFEDITEKAGVAGTGSWKTGVTMADVNADGRLDIYVCQVGQYKQFAGQNQLFINNGNGTFSERAAEYGLALKGFCTQSAFFDYDLDGDLDCFVLCHSVHSAGSYRDTALTRRPDPPAADRLLRNDGGHFTDVSQEAGIYGGTAGYGLGLAIGDLNNDGYPDIYVGNDFHENDFLYYNQGGKYFLEDISGSMGHTSNFTMGCDLADVNNDGLQDILSLDMRPEDEVLLKASQPADQYDIYQFKHEQGYHWQLARNCLQINQGPRNKTGMLQFSDVAWLAGVAATDWSWSALMADYDLDGHKDIFISNGIVRRPNDMDYLKFISSAEVQRKATDLDIIQEMPSGAVPNYAFQNDRSGRFLDVSSEWGLNHRGCSNGAVYADLDNDGDLDIVTNNINEPASLLRNNSNGAHWLKLRFKGEGSNTFGIGAKVQLWAGGEMQIFENQPVRGFQSAVPPEIVIGLGDGKEADSMIVTWLDGRRQTLQKVKSRQVLLMEQKNASRNILPIAAATPVFILWPGINIAHEARQLTLTEKLAPWLLTVPQPRIAIGDVNGDGADDLFVPGASTEVFFQLKNNWIVYPPILPRKGTVAEPLPVPISGTVFGPANNKAMPPHWGVCDAVATFFDADGDAVPDLYIGMAGKPSGAESALLQDVLALNKDGGRFPKGPTAGLLPAMQENTSCVRAVDFDGDGDQDLFVGAGAVDGAYGLPGRSFLLENDGKGRFTDRTAALAPGLDRIGMVSDARWADVDGNGRPDLIVCGQWMPVIVFKNTPKGFVKSIIPNTEGFWNTLAHADLDGDGDQDLVAGNFGLNSPLQASAKAPLGLWVKDFDGNGSFDPVISYYRQGKHYPLADKDWLLSQLPGVKKDYVQYRKYSESIFEDVFSEGKRKGATHLQVIMLESCWLENDGKGNFKVHVLPDAAQGSPIFALLPGDFDGDGVTDLLLGGNFFEVHPAIGRQDACSGLFLRGRAGGGYEPVPPFVSGFRPEGAVRDIQLLKRKDGTTLIVVTPYGGKAQAFLQPGGRI